MERLRELGLYLPYESPAFPVVLLDGVTVIWTSKGSHEVLAYYTSRIGETSTLWTSSAASAGRSSNK
jgi:hypothetical protein